MSALSGWKDGVVGQVETTAGKQGSPLLYLLGFVMALFLAILIFVYIVTKQTNPVFLDEHGKPVTSDSAHSHAH